MKSIPLHWAIPAALLTIVGGAAEIPRNSVSAAPRCSYSRPSDHPDFVGTVVSCREDGRGDAASVEHENLPSDRTRLAESRETLTISSFSGVAQQFSPQRTLIGGDCLSRPVAWAENLRIDSANGRPCDPSGQAGPNPVNAFPDDSTMRSVADEMHAIGSLLPTSSVKHKTFAGLESAGANHVGTILPVASVSTTALLLGSPNGAWNEGFEYDALGRLTKVTFANGAVTNYMIDNAGNRTNVNTTVP
jgi:YD repeat-containing protein